MLVSLGLMMVVTRLTEYINSPGFPGTIIRAQSVAVPVWVRCWLNQGQGGWSGHAPAGRWEEVWGRPGLLRAIPIREVSSGVIAGCWPPDGWVSLWSPLLERSQEMWAGPWTGSG